MASGSAKPFFVYAFWSDGGRRFYVGLSEDVDLRLQQHNAGLSRWTARHIPWRCVFQRRFPSLTEARKFENLLKRQKGGRGFFRFVGLDPRDFDRAQGS